jgi:hypothetical protein
MFLEADRKAAGFTSWPVISLRHSFASFHLARFRNPKDLALELGHTRPDTLPIIENTLFIHFSPAISSIGVTRIVAPWPPRGQI